MYIIPFGLTLLPIFATAKPPNHEYLKDEVPDYETFQRLLEQVDPPSLHAALHDYSPKFKHGMFREDKSAVEYIHRDDASLATSIIKLAKRQESVNGTITTAVASTDSPTSSIDLAASSASSADTASNTATVTEASTIPTDKAATSDTTASPVTITSTNTELAPDVPSDASTHSLSRSVGSVFTFTDSAGVIIVTTVGGEASTIGSVAPSPTVPASESGSTVLSGASITSKPASISSVFVRTTTLPDGRKTTVTAVTVVPGDDEAATPAGEAGVASGTGTGSATPGVQTGLAGRTDSTVREMLCLVGGAVGVAMLM